MKERLSSKHSDNFTYNIVCITPSSPPDYQKNGTQNQGREHEISETGLEEGARGAGYPQILHKTAYGGSTSQKPPKAKRAMQPSGFRCQHVHARNTTVLVNIPLECFTSYHNEAGRSYLKSINNTILKCG